MRSDSELEENWTNLSRPAAIDAIHAAKLSAAKDLAMRKRGDLRVDPHSSDRFALLFRLLPKNFINSFTFGLTTCVSGLIS